MSVTAPIIIAEAGVNHNGDVGRAMDMVAAAAAAGVDYVKFQAFRADTLVADGCATAGYQAQNTGISDQKTLLQSLELGQEAFAALAANCRQHGVRFLCTAFDPEQIEYFVDLGMDCIKIASGELTNRPALVHAASFGLPVILSTGMATLEEIAVAVDCLAGRGAGEITLLHCTSLYPAPDASINLRAMQQLRDRFGLQVGYSDHSEGIHVPIAAAALGAAVIEKHFTLDRNLPGPDHLASLEPAELAAMVQAVRRTAAALGDGRKQPSDAERAVAALVRRSWHALRPIAAGTVLSAQDVGLRRPEGGLKPDAVVIGRRARHAIPAGQPLDGDSLD